ncbi:acetolactate synthase-1/2/3 large subunit [Krasilnikovia cinnamomea]|uniref:Acetolactate synthase-1/2/3 large subunit n=1 Tax=Krasilnikovia cinnamomea TaxID=349313 RepID=A0A4Q7ZPR7_9ACTN|nr:thiamine pyrophosphate-binding protein [Krasilnikovia cinnamomea]RZU52711.1 acetolactate synthase-1/2/3 large subunit [Krasilnikovia cinnamomea]
MRQRLVDHLVRELARSGVDHVFGVGGANIEDLYDAVHAARPAIRAVVAKHEFSAATMADGYARATGRLGVVAATSGGGAMNLLPGLAEAYASRVPVLALVGQPPRAQQGRGAFQDSSGQAGSLDARRLFAPVSRLCARVDDPGQLSELLPRAIAAALSPPRGPAVLLLPKDVQQSLLRAAPSPAAVPLPAPAADRAVRDRAVRALRGARRVLVIAGEGVAAAHARAELAELARRLGAWVAVTPDAKDVFDNADPRFAGVAGVMGHRNVADCLREAEVCLLVGTRWPVLARGGLDAALGCALVVCIDPEPPYVSGLALRGDPRTVLRDVTARLPAGSRPCPPHDGPVPLPITAGRGPGAMSTVEAVAAVATALPEHGHVFVDAGNAGAAAIHLLPAPRRGRFVVAVGMGGMGYAFGAGIGAALATGQRTYVLAGDGAFFMHGMEVHTAIESGAPVTFVIFNNNAHGMCVTRERLFYGDAYSFNLFRPTDIGAGVAAAFPSLPVARPADAAGLGAALRRRNDPRHGPAFVALDVDPHEIPPFQPFLTPDGRHPADAEENTDEYERVHAG